METITATKSKRDKGFTLVELLIVIVILGVLATVTVFAVRGISSRGETTACQADKSTLETAAEAYYAQWSVSPSEAALVAGGFIKGLSPKYEVYAGTGTAPSTITVQAGGGCTS